MDKRTPTYDLDAIKDSVKNDGARTTLTAKKSMTKLRMLDRSNFYKSMTTHNDHRVWQDVYHASYLGHDLYVKIMVDDEGYLVVSFKEL